MSSVNLEVAQAEKSYEEHEGHVKTIFKKKYHPKALIKPKTPIQRVFGNKNIVKDHYFTSGSKIDDVNQRDILSEPSPFVYPKDLETFSYRVMSKAWRDNLRRKEFRLKYNMRNNYQSRQNLDILNRLFVKEPELQSMKTILDIDPNFFTIVEGRPIGEKFNVRDYIRDLRECLRSKIVAGYREDEVILIEENFIEEQRIIDEIKSRYQSYVDTFEEFLSNDHSTSMELLRQAEKEATKAFEKYEVYRELSKDYGALKAQVYNLEEKWRNCKMYQKFLYLVSPLHWRKVHDYYHLKPGSSHQSLIETESSIFEKYRLGAGSEANTLDAMIKMFLEDCATQKEPLLYFKEPYELLKVFRFIELQNLNSLLHSEELAIPLENVREGMLEAQKKFDEQITSVQEIIDSLIGEIVWEEQRARSLEELAMELINGEFRKLISDEEVLSMYVFVEDVYETRIAPNDANLSVGDMMKAIEMNYRHFLIQLDELPQDKVQKAESECYAEEARIMEIAVDAAKKVLQVESLAKTLKRVLEPRFISDKRVFHPRSPLPTKPDKPPTPPRILTKDETDYLSFFTDYCRHTDKVENFEIDEAVNDLVKRFK
ncbi:protein of unknown function (DUF4200) [Popillia japonica]|uniref:DUF4200 domain-containing protein n=1 Tax=Popillia japonica TaxID=7064 RepID=A0AAW1HFH7_POPJA